jgi:hypothetical protein
MEKFPARTTAKLSGLPADTTVVLQPTYNFVRTGEIKCLRYHVDAIWGLRRLKRLTCHRGGEEV